MGARRVAVTGLGCVTPLGSDVASTWAGALAGRSGIRPFTRFDPDDLSVRFGGEIAGEPDLGDLSPKEARRLDPFVAYAVAAAREALAHAGLGPGEVDADRVGVAIGSGIGGLSTICDGERTRLERGARRVSPFVIPMCIGNMASGYVSMREGLRGPNLCHTSACATGTHALGEALRTIQRGDAVAMVAGGSEAPLVPIGVAGFANMKALSTRNDDPPAASRPFDLDRDGFVIAEGAGVLVLEDLEHARARGAPILALLTGYGASADAYQITSPDPDGRGAARCIRQALADAGLALEALDYVNAHATGTPAGDPVEVRALREVFGSHLERVAVSATKSMTGHLLGAAGGVEAILCVKVLESGSIPPTINLERPDPDCALDHVANKARQATVGAALSNSFGFGGTNSAVVLQHPDAANG